MEIKTKVQSDTTIMQMVGGRDSNLELFRIVMMLVIIAHHYVVNSGLTSLYDFQEITVNMVFLQIFGWGGKTAINCFLLITGYFTCKKIVSKEKWVKLVLEVIFYRVLISSVFLLLGYTPLGILSLIKSMIPFVLNYTTGADAFTALFVLLLLFVPFVNKLIGSLSKKEYQILLILLLTYFCFIPTFLFRDNWSGLGWYATVYLIGAYMRLHLAEKYKSLKFAAILSAISLSLTWVSILVVDFVGVKFGFEGYNHMYGTANKLLAILPACGLFLLFKNLPVKQNRIINIFSSATFGVLMIHANSDTMRQWLWKDLLDNMGQYDNPLISLVIHAVLSVIIIYIVCACIELLRIRYIEKPLFLWLRKKYKIEEKLYL